ncbi:hypothetical protein CRG98_032892 [Punica granatum]|uniref:Uncharacterized protein n=1 Tax=Punica granatum TaxID=22663 RepID=A0A2I0ITH0_PUNGR|nr:hypothetical protein CRG98_032892 [Punica granatum]
MPIAVHEEETARLPSRVEISDCLYGFLANRVDPGLFSETDHHSHLRRTVWIDPTTLGTNDHHGHLEGSLGYSRPPTLPQNSIGSLRGDVRPDLCQSGPKFQTCSVLGDFYRTVWIDPTTLGTNDHHGHLEGSLGYSRSPTLPQNSIGSLRGDVRPDLCQSGLSSIPAGSVWCHSGLFNRKQPKPDPSTVQPNS